MKFEGITSDTVYLLAENRFNNSKSFYEEHKSQINQGAVWQMRAIVEDLTPTLININPDFILDPVKCVCRVRRDTRFTHDKSLYRANLWLMIRHKKNNLPTPGFWFEFTTEDVSWGLGVMSTTPAFMEFFRKEILNRSDRFNKACKKLYSAGIVNVSEKYKKDKADSDGIKGKYLREWYNSKEIVNLYSHDDIDILSQPETLIATLTDALKKSSDMYNLLLEITTKFNTSSEF